MGLTPSDIHNLEYLEDRDALKELPGGFRWLSRNVREDVIIYFETFADYLEEKLLQEIQIPYHYFEKLTEEKTNYINFLPYRRGFKILNRFLFYILIHLLATRTFTACNLYCFILVQN